MAEPRQEGNVSGIVKVSPRIRGNAASSIPISGLINQGNVYKELRFKPLNEFPVQGEAGILYIDTTNGDIYYWNEQEYVKLCDPDVAQFINDLDISTETTWSSSKINETFVKSEDLPELTKQIFSGTTAYWNAQSSLLAKKDCMYVYTDYSMDGDTPVPAVKIGTGNAYLIDLPFVYSGSAITPEMIAFWNNKVTAYIDNVNNENLILSKD